MASLQPSLDYSQRDFIQLRTRIFTLIQSVFPEWTDDAVTNFGNILAELPCFVGDVLAYYQDNQAGESRITTARLRQNILALAKLVGYRAHGATAARVTQRFTLANTVAGTVTIPRGTPVQTQEITSPLVFQTQEDLVIPGGSTIGEVTAENSTIRSFAATSSGLPDLKIALPAIPYLDGSIGIVAVNGDYELVENFLASGSLDNHFTLTLDADDRATIAFGNGIKGAIPAGLITIVYKTGGGRAGRVEASKLSVLSGAWRDEFGTLVQIATTNPEPSTPAVDRESVEQIRQLAPLAVRVQQRAVCREDFEISAIQVPGVLFALMVTKNELPPMAENFGILYCVPSGGGELTDELKAEIASRFEAGGATPKTITFTLEVRTAAYLTVDVEARVYCQKGVPKATIKARAVAALAAFFDLEVDDGTGTGSLIRNPALNFGFYFQDSTGAPTGSLAWSDLFNAIRDVQGITKVDAGLAGFLLNGVRGDVAMDAFDFPRLGTFTLIDAETGIAF